MENTMAEGYTITLVGLLIVFAALAFIASIVGLLRKLDSGSEQRETREAAAALEKDQNIDELTLVLISSAVATVLKGRAHIRSVRRIAHIELPSSPWSSQGRAVLHGSHVPAKKPGTNGS